ncbi:MAG: hypothetical protein ACQETH_11260 [Candidatus Rifleibacteriota bacterium]
MKNKNHTIIAALLIIAVLIAGIYAYKIHQTLNAMAILKSTLENMPKKVKISPKYIPNCCKLPIPLPRSYENRNFQNANYKELVELAQKHLQKSDPVIEQAYANFKKQIKEPALDFEPPEDPYFFGKIPHLTVCRKINRFLSNLGYFHAKEGNHRKAFKAFLGSAGIGVALFGNKVKNYELVPFLIGKVCLKETGYNLLLVAKKLELTRQDLKTLLISARRFDHQFPSFLFIYRYERNKLTSFNNSLKKLTQKTGKPFVEVSYFKKLKTSTNQILKNRLDKLQKLWKQDYRETAEETAEYLDSFSEFLRESEKNKLLWLQPQQLLARQYLYLTAPNFYSVRPATLLSENRWHIGIIAVAIYNYKRVNGSFPKNLKSLEKWIGTKLPKNAFTGKNFDYTDNPLQLSSIETAETGKDRRELRKRVYLPLPQDFKGIYKKQLE